MAVKPPEGRARQDFRNVQLDVETEAIQKVRDHGEAETKEKVETVGVVFVHGVGSQTKSSVVREFAQPAVDWLNRWYDARPNASRFRIIWSRLSYGESGDLPARFAVHIPAYKSPGGDAHPERIWIVAEAWWAARLEAPPLKTMVIWAWRIYYRNLVRLALSTTRLLEGTPTRTARQVIETVSGVLLLFGFALAGVFGIVPLAIVFLAAQLPIPALEQFILVRLLRPLLVDNLGDHYVYMYDEVQSLHIRRGVGDTIAWLARTHKCDRILLAGHSQGALVAYDALTAEAAADVTKVTKLITFGGAINNARTAPAFIGTRRRHELQPPPKHKYWLDVWSDYDPVPGGPLGPPAPNQSLRVSNTMNVLIDHGGYLANHEEFVSRLVREIDSPDAHDSSRYFPGAARQTEYVERRHARLVVIVSARILAIFLVAGALGLRTFGSSQVDLVQDGRTVWARVVDVPLVGNVIGLPVDVLRLIRPPAATPALAPEPAVQPGRAGAAVLTGIYVLLRLAWAVLMALLATAIIGAAFVAVYSIAVNLTFVPWHQREALNTPAGGPQAIDGSFSVGLRVFAVVVVTVVAAFELARLPAFETLIRAATGGAGL